MAVNKKVLLIAVFLAAFSFRILFIDVKSLNSDEPFIYFLSTKNPADMVIGLYDIGWPPFYYILLHFWRMIFDSEIWMRLFSLVFGILSLGAVWHYAKKFFGEKTAFFALLLAAFSWLGIYYSQEIRPHSLIILLSTISFFSFFECVKGDSKKSRVIYFASSLFGTLVSYHQLLVFIVQGAYLLFFARSRKNILLLAAVSAFSLLSVSHWLFPSFGAKTTSLLSDFDGYPSFFSIPAALSGFASWHPSFPLALASVPIALFAMYLFLKNMKTDAEKFIAFSLFLPVLLLFLVSLPAKFLGVRYFIPFYGFYLIMVAKGIQLTGKKGLAAFLLALLIIANIGQIVYSAGIFDSVTKDGRELVACMEGLADKNDLVLVFSHFGDWGFKYYYKKPNPVLAYENFESFMKILGYSRSSGIWIYCPEETALYDKNRSVLRFLESAAEKTSCDSVYYLPKAK